MSFRNSIVNLVASQEWLFFQAAAIFPQGCSRMHTISHDVRKFRSIVTLGLDGIKPRFIQFSDFPFHLRRLENSFCGIHFAATIWIVSEQRHRGLWLMKLRPAENF
jgi:hypothetical protein